MASRTSENVVNWKLFKHWYGVLKQGGFYGTNYHWNTRTRWNWKHERVAEKTDGQKNLTPFLDIQIVRDLCRLVYYVSFALHTAVYLVTNTRRRDDYSKSHLKWARVKIGRSYNLAPRRATLSKNRTTITACIMADNQVVATRYAFSHILLLKTNRKIHKRHEMKRKIRPARNFRLIQHKAPYDMAKINCRTNNLFLSRYKLRDKRQNCKIWPKIVLPEKMKRIKECFFLRVWLSITKRYSSATFILNELLTKKSLFVMFVQRLDNLYNI